MKFEDFADNSTPYMYHCHVLMHEDDGMMGQFVVTSGATGLLTGKQNSSNIYPNPSKAVVTATTPNPEDLEQKIIVSDMIGRQAYSSKTDASKITFDTSGWPAGVSLVSIASKSGNFTHKLIVEPR